MKGKILGLGAISGDDGNRYTFEISDVSNLEGRSVENLTGCEVDFEVSENMAKNIFITGGSINMANIQGQLMANDTQSIRFKFLLAIGLDVGGSIIYMIPLLGWLLGPIMWIAGFVLFVLAVLGTSRVSESKSLFKNFVIFFLAFLALMTFVFISTFTLLVSSSSLASSALVMFMRGSYVNALSLTGIVLMLIAFITFVVVMVFALKFARELAFVTRQKILLWATYLDLFAMLIVVIPILGWVLWIICQIATFIMLIVGFYQMREIRKRTDSDVIPWF